MIQNYGGLLDWNSKTATENKNTRVNNTAKNRVHEGHMLSLDDGYCTEGCLRGKIFMNQVKILPMNCLLKHILATTTGLNNVSKVLKSWNRPIREKFPLKTTCYIKLQKFL